LEKHNQQTEILKRGAALIDAGSLKVHADNVFALAQAAEAHRRLESGNVTGKLVLNVDA
jgi:NADPH2:quinone reductase